MHKAALVLLIVTGVLSLFGLLMVYDASSFVSFQTFGNRTHYLTEQTISLAIGIVGLIIASFIPYKTLLKLALPLLIGTLFLLVLVFVPGIGLSLNGAHRWIRLGFGTLQPTEIAKVTLAIYLAAWLSRSEKGRLTAFLVLIGLTLGLVMLQPDMGTGMIILGETLLLYFLSGSPVKQFLAILPGIGIVGAFLAIIEPYRMQRLVTFLNPDTSINTQSYHVRQILIALGTGGVFGVGIGNSLQKYAYLPENMTDSIFAIIGEEFGFLGTTIFLVACIIFLYCVFSIATNAPSKEGKLLAGGIGAFLGMQMLINLAAQTALIPLTGVPLPFVSYGGTALIVDLITVGIVLNIARRQ